MMLNKKFKPYTTEKTSSLMEKENKYTFLIDKTLNKISIKQYFKSNYDVEISTVNIVKNAKKKKRRGKIVGYTKQKNKAIVSLVNESDKDKISKLF